MHLVLLYKICSETTNIEEEEVCKMIRECLDLRKKYVYKDVPWKTEPVETNSDPYHFEPVEATAVSLLLLCYYLFSSHSEIFCYMWNLLELLTVNFVLNCSVDIVILL